MRGEHAQFGEFESPPNGSSPHAWGAFSVEAARNLVQRFIPTCVGSMAHPGRPATWCGVHPHMRGEHPISGCPACPASGSFPHAWGACCGPSPGPCPSRFIPTCVGSIAQSSPPLRVHPVHPHMRGEHGAGERRSGGRIGSSPHAWGASRGWRCRAWPGRFIPTCVGSICISSSNPSA